MNKLAVFTLMSVALASIMLPSKSIAQSADQTTDLSIPAQIGDIQEQIDSTIEPQIPSPGQQVTITLSAYGTDLERANITWVHNGKQELKGAGEKQFTFTASSIGGSDQITATVEPVNGPAVTKSFTISPAEVDLLWEANTYTPPFYKGKALFTPQANVTFVAIPNMIARGSRVPSNKTVFTWKTDYEVQGDKSGLGRNTFSFTGPIILDSHIFEVDAYSSTDPNVTAASKQTLEAVSPSVNIYEDHPLYGLLFNHSLLDSFNMNDPEKRIAAYPFFFSTTNKNSGLTYQWTLDDSTLQIPATQNAMSFRKSNIDNGTAEVKVKIDSTTNLLQEAFGSLSLYFNDNTGVFVRQ